MKFLLMGTLFLTSTTFAQTIDIAGLKKLMTSKKATLEQAHVGMTKKLTTTAKETLPAGVCDYTITSTQTILKFEGERMIVLAKENFAPAASAACQSAGYEAFEESIVFYEDKPSLDGSLKELDALAKDVKSISKAGEIVTLALQVSDTDPETGTTYSDNLSIKYDLSKPAFRNIILNQGQAHKIVGEDQPDTNLSTVNLTNVLFCDNNDGDSSECMQGDFSDILF